MTALATKKTKDTTPNETSERTVKAQTAARNKKAAARKKQISLQLKNDEEARQYTRPEQQVEDEGSVEMLGRSWVTVFDDGTTIALEGFKACPCPEHQGAILPMQRFGYRRMASGLIRPQSRCKTGR